VTAEDIPVADHGRTAELFWNGFSSTNSMVLLTLGALAAGFVVYVMLEYRHTGRVLAPEQNWN
jgi:hypothetical protein